MSKQDRKRIKFNAAVPIKPKHSLVSSSAAGSNIKGFTPSYEKDGSTENMHCLMSMEYNRIWFKELKDFERVTYAIQNSCLADSQIQRRFVQRTFKKKVDPMEVLPPIKIKKFQNIKSKTVCQNPNPPRRPDLVSVGVIDLFKPRNGKPEKLNAKKDSSDQVAKNKSPKQLGAKKGVHDFVKDVANENKKPETVQIAQGNDEQCRDGQNSYCPVVRNICCNTCII